MTEAEVEQVVLVAIRDGGPFRSFEIRKRLTVVKDERHLENVLRRLKRKKQIAFGSNIGWYAL